MKTKRPIHALLLCLVPNGCSSSLSNVYSDALYLTPLLHPYNIGKRLSAVDSVFNNVCVDRQDNILNSSILERTPFKTLGKGSLSVAITQNRC
jgi:hypothetical protein